MRKSYYSYFRCAGGGFGIRKLNFLIPLEKNLQAEYLECINSLLLCVT